MNQASFVKNRTKPRKWSEEETEQFYVWLKKFGMSFDMISDMMNNPPRTAKQCMQKYKRELLANPTRIKQCVNQNQKVDAETRQKFDEMLVSTKYYYVPLINFLRISRRKSGKRKFWKKNFLTAYLQRKQIHQMTDVMMISNRDHMNTLRISGRCKSELSI